MSALSSRADVGPPRELSGIWVAKYSEGSFSLGRLFRVFFFSSSSSFHRAQLVFYQRLGEKTVVDGWMDVVSSHMVLIDRALDAGPCPSSQRRGIRVSLKVRWQRLGGVRRILLAFGSLAFGFVAVTRLAAVSMRGACVLCCKGSKVNVALWLRAQILSFQDPVCVPKCELRKYFAIGSCFFLQR